MVGFDMHNWPQAVPNAAEPGQGRGVEPAIGLLKSIKADKRGASAAEYALMIAVMVGIVLAAVTALGAGIGAGLTSTGANIAAAQAD